VHCTVSILAMDFSIFSKISLLDWDPINEGDGLCRTLHLLKRY